MILYVGSFILLLAPLIFIHELGHYLFAKLFGVRVDVFSMGFGPKIFKKTYGETEYAVSIVPLGGYVKLLGQDPTEVVAPEFADRTLVSKKPWQRFLVFVGGPLFNFLFAIFIFSILMFIGEPHVKSLLERIPANSPAYQVGFRDGDLVTAIDEEKVNTFEDLARIVGDSIDKPLQFHIKRGGSDMNLSATPVATPGYSMYGEPIDVGNIEGLLSSGRYPVVGISDPNSPSGRAGMKSGDEIVTFNGQSVNNFEKLSAAVETALKGGVKEFIFGIAAHDLSHWSIERRIEPAKKADKEIKTGAASLDKLGIYSSELFIASMVKGSPAETAGFKSGDRIVSVGDVKLEAFANLREQVQSQGEKHGKFMVTVERGGKMIKKEITPNINEVKDGLGRDVKQYLVGVYPLFVQSEPELFVARIFNPFRLVAEAWSRTIDLSVKTVVSLKKLATRKVSMGTLGGPLLIGKLAGESLERGLAYFLKVMALISVSLAIFNILPVPVLDGGHITLLFIEVLRGKPFSIRQSEFVQQVGLTLILLLLVVVMFNDISRVGIPAIKHMLE